MSQQELLKLYKLGVREIHLTQDSLKKLQNNINAVCFTDSQKGNDALSYICGIVIKKQEQPPEEQS